MQPLLFWNNTPYAQCLAGVFGKENVITDCESLENATQNWNRFNSIIVLCELNWSVNSSAASLQSLQGIELVKDLRRRRVKLPVIFTSFLSRKQVYANKLDKAIVNAVGHRFVQLPNKPEQFKEKLSEVHPLNELELYDIIHNYCSIGGIVKMLLHSLNGLQNVLNGSLDTSDVVREKLRNAILQVYQVFNKEASEALAAFDNEFVVLTVNNLNRAIRFVESRGTELIDIYSPDEQSNSIIKAKGNWKLLLLDDEITEGHILIEKLRARDVDIICTDNANDAKQIVENETLLSLVVSDYRLEEEIDRVKVHQEVQGYQFLKEVSEKRPGYLRLVALSSLPRKFLMESFKHYGLRTEIFSKRDYLENEATINLLCDELVEIGNENAEAIVRTPGITSETWQYFEPFYWHHRNSINYEANERYINQKASEYCEGIKENRFPFRLSGYTSLNLDGKAKPIIEIKNKKTGEETIQTNEKVFKIYFEKCICRRVALWYTQYNKAATVKDVHKIIQGNDYTGILTASTPKNQVNINLALSLDEFPWNMTIEEKHWLMYHMNVTDIEKTEQKELAVLKAFSHSINRWLIENELFDKIIVKAEFEHFFSDGKERYGSNFRMTKLFLHKIYLFLVGHDELVQGLQKEIIQWQSRIFPQTGLSDNIVKFKTYLEDLRKKLKYTKSITREAKVKTDTQEEFYSNIARSAASKIKNKHELPQFGANAQLFYNCSDEVLKDEFNFEINKADLRSQQNWIEALISFHNKQIEMYEGSNVSFDEVKAYRRQGKANAEDIDV